MSPHRPGRLLLLTISLTGSGDDADFATELEAMLAKLVRGLDANRAAASSGTGQTKP